MRIVSALIAGVRGAENGTADIHKKGTSVRATIYSDIDGSVHSDNGSQLSLDSNGSIEVYVNEYVDIVVKDSDGTTVHEWTEGDTANNVEYRGQSFTGTDPDNGSTGTGSSYPISLQEILDLWYTNAGGDPSTAGTGIDWKVTAGGATAPLATWIGALGGSLIYNVKAATYNAQGDGTTNDTTAIQAAIDAADAAGGGVVVFPAGTYLISSALSLKATVSLLGVGRGVSVISSSSTTANIITVDDLSTTEEALVSGLTLSHSTSGSTGIVIDLNGKAGWLTVADCILGNGNSTAQALYDGGSSVIQYVTVRGCRVTTGLTTTDMIDCQSHSSLGRWRIQGCDFLPPVSGMSAAFVKGNNVDISDCLFKLGLCTSGTVVCYEAPAASDVLATVTGCTITSSGGATVTGMLLGAYTSGSIFTEGSNTMPGQADSNFTAYSYTPAFAQIGAVVKLLTRETRHYRVSNDSATVSVDAKNYGTAFVDRSGTTGAMITVSGNGPEGATFGLVVEGGGGINDIDFEQSVESGTLNLTGIDDQGYPKPIGSGSITSLRLRSAANTTALYWVTEGEVLDAATT